MQATPGLVSLLIESDASVLMAVDFQGKNPRQRAP